MKQNKVLLGIFIGAVVLAAIVGGIFYLSLSSPSGVKFRTSNYLYGENSAIAYGKEGGDLAIYSGYVVFATAEKSYGTCQTAVHYDKKILTYLFDVPGMVTVNGVVDEPLYANGAKKTAIYSGNVDPNFIYVCSDYNDGGFGLASYYKNSAWASTWGTPVPNIEISNSTKSINPQLEVMG